MPSYSGVWNLPAQMQAIGSDNWPINGPFTYIEDVFSTYLYTGNSSTQTITNGIDLAGEGGLVWIKRRDAWDHAWVDTARGTGSYIYSNSSAQQDTGVTDALTSFNSDGFSLGSNEGVNNSATNIVSWTFGKQAKFFDVVTYTGDGTSARNISHSLGSAPGFMVVKVTSESGNWMVYHRSLTSAAYGMNLNTTIAETSAPTLWNSTAPTSSVFTVGSALNGNGKTYVAYLFAHNAGGFGLTGTDNVISCGSYTGNGVAGNSITLGYEPQFVLIKNSTSTSDWTLYDNMRGISETASPRLSANTTNAEVSASYVKVKATGFTVETSPLVNASGQTYIYIAIRRGPMKTPTTGTEVFTPVLAQSAAPGFPAGIVTDAYFMTYQNSDATYQRSSARLLGANNLQTSAANAENADAEVKWDYMNGAYTGGALDSTFAAHCFRRAPGFFDVVCFTTQASTNMRIAHNLGVAPELILMKSRSLSTDWNVYYPTGAINKYLVLNSTATPTTTGGYNFWGSTAPSSTDFGLNVNETFGADATMVAYLFATVAGVSKVGSYTGTGTTKQIDCGFTGGARFVMIKRTDSTGGWYVWDSARGIVAGNDPYTQLNSTAGWVTNTDYVDTYASGFEISSTAPAAINANGGSFIFLAIA